MPFYDTTTDRLLVINWSQHGKPKRRQTAFGGYINGKDFKKLDEGAYRVPKTMTIDELDEMLEEIIRPSDQAILTYPYGETDNGASAMRIRIYGKRTESEK